MSVGDPGNPTVAVVPFQPEIYSDCQAAPAGQSGCLTVGGVTYPYEIGELEITVDQYVAFLNTVDPDGTNKLGLYLDNMSPTAWPRYGSISRASGTETAQGHHYSVAYPAWAHKPIGFTDFHGAARFVNSLANGDVVSRTRSSSDGFDVVTYSIRLSSRTEQGMYDLAAKGATRTGTTGFVIPSNDEWIKAAYYDPAGGGTDSYWEYPTGPFKEPNAALLDPATGDVVNASTQPLSAYTPGGRTAASGTYPNWCPPEVGKEACETTNPLGLSADAYQTNFRANLATVGQTATRSPWGTLDQGGNVVEWTDSIAASPTGSADGRTWRYEHGGVTNAPAYQLWLSALGHTPESDPVFEYAYPWVGFRIGVIGDLAPS